MWRGPPVYMQREKKSRVISRSSRLIAAFMLMSMLVATAWAEHEADHRYTVEGFVLDAAENPRSDVKVVVTADEGLLGRTVTDRRGFYQVQLHLHNTDLGKKLTVKAGEQETEIEVMFDPGDRETARVHDLNFIGARTTQSDLGFRGFPTWLYVVLGLIIVAVVARSIATAMKKRRKLLQKEQKALKKQKRKKARRKPRRSRSG